MNTRLISGPSGSEQQACVFLWKMKSKEHAQQVKVASNDTAMKPEYFTMGCFSSPQGLGEPLLSLWEMGLTPIIIPIGWDGGLTPQLGTQGGGGITGR